MWNHEDEVVSVTFDASAVTTATLREAIESLGYGVEEVEASAGTSKTAAALRFRVPESAPAELREAFARAVRGDRLVVVDFWATWCAPCIALKKTTLADAGVMKLLQGAELVEIDLDEHPGLGKLWGVSSVPDVLFLAPDGRVIDRLRDFEEAAPFSKRLAAALETVGKAKGRK